MEPNDAVRTRVENQVHIGHGIYFTAPTVDSLMARSKHSIFVKELGVAVYGSEVLKRSSVAGIASRRMQTSAKDPIDPTKLLANKGWNCRRDRNIKSRPRCN